MPDSFGNPLPEDLIYSPNTFSNSFGGSQPQPALAIDTGINQDIMNNVGNPALSTGTPTQGSWSDNFFSNGQGGQGWGTAAIGAASGVAQTLLGFQQLSEGKKQNEIANNQWQAQFDIQKSEYDRRTAERNARVNANKASAAPTGG